MKTINSCFRLFFFVCLVSFGFRTAFAQEAAAPGPDHEHLKKFEGTWTARIKMEEDGTVSDGMMVYKMELGGLWLVSKFEGQLFGKFEGRGLDTYDARKKKFVSVWADSMSTQPMLLEGDYDKDKKTMTMKNRPVNAEEPSYRMVTQWIDHDRHKFTMYMVNANGAETKIMTIDYTRKK